MHNSISFIYFRDVRKRKIRLIFRKQFIYRLVLKISFSFKVFIKSLIIFLPQYS